MACPVCGERFWDFSNKPPRYRCGYGALPNGFNHFGQPLMHVFSQCTVGPTLKSLEAEVEEEPAGAPVICSCDMMVLMRSGCQCGAFQKEQGL